MDRDPRFRSAWFREFYRLTGVHLHFTTGYKSQSNGLAENANRTLSKLLRSASTDHQLAWFRMLKNAVMTMNLRKCVNENVNGQIVCVMTYWRR
eukprot:COSAG02_NODE_929_length_15840_cov_55.918493_7_plen_94_part_00